MIRIHTGIDKEIGMYYTESVAKNAEATQCTEEYGKLKYQLSEGDNYFDLLVYHNLAPKQALMELKTFVNSLYIGRELDTNYLNVRRLILEK